MLRKEENIITQINLKMDFDAAQFNFYTFSMMQQAASAHKSLVLHVFKQHLSSRLFATRPSQFVLNHDYINKPAILRPAVITIGGEDRIGYAKFLNDQIHRYIIEYNKTLDEVVKHSICQLYVLYYLTLQNHPLGLGVLDYLYPRSGFTIFDTVNLDFSTIHDMVNDTVKGLVFL